jgi:transcriptional regulator with XRE-family HTH domain
MTEAIGKISSFEDAILLVMARRNCGTEKIAEYLGVKRATLYKVRTGLCWPSKKLAEKLADELGIDCATMCSNCGRHLSLLHHEFCESKSKPPHAKRGKYKEKPAATTPATIAIQDSLAVFARQIRYAGVVLDGKDLTDLSAVSFRGRQPQSVEQWISLYMLISSFPDKPKS